jgi:hypothetical protein
MPTTQCPPFESLRASRTQCLRRNVLPSRASGQVGRNACGAMSSLREPQGKSDAMPTAQCPPFESLRASRTQCLRRNVLPSRASGQVGRNAFGAMSSLREPQGKSDAMPSAQCTSLSSIKYIYKKPSRSLIGEAFFNDLIFQ